MGRRAVAWIGSLILFSLVALFVWLGFWQLERSAEKEHLMQLEKGRSHDQLLQLGDQTTDAEQMRYRQVQVKGTMIEEAQFFLDNRKRYGVAGYHLLVPVQISDSRYAVVVNRGWIAQGETRAQLPRITVPEGEQEISGRVRVPTTHGFRFDQDEEADLRLYIDLEQISRSISTPVLPFVVRQSDPLGEGEQGLVRDWKQQRQSITPEMHHGYAVQWFAFALLVMGGWFALWLRQRQQ